MFIVINQSILVEKFVVSNSLVAILVQKFAIYQDSASHLEEEKSFQIKVVGRDATNHSSTANIGAVNHVILVGLANLIPLVKLKFVSIANVVFVLYRLCANQSLRENQLNVTLNAGNTKESLNLLLLLVEALLLLKVKVLSLNTIPKRYQNLQGSTLNLLQNVKNFSPMQLWKKLSDHFLE